MADDPAVTTETPPADSAPKAEPVDEEAIFKKHFKEKLDLDYDQYKELLDAPPVKTTQATQATTGLPKETPPEPVEMPDDGDVPSVGQLKKLLAAQDKKLADQETRLTEKLQIARKQDQDNLFWAQATEVAGRMLAQYPQCADEDVKDLVWTKVEKSINANFAARGKRPTGKDLETAVKNAVAVVDKIAQTATENTIKKAAEKARASVPPTRGGGAKPKDWPAKTDYSNEKERLDRIARAMKAETS